MMNSFTSFAKRQHRFCSVFLNNLGFLACFVALNFHPFFLQLFYFLILSLLGYLGLKVSKPRTHVRPNDLDLVYTSVSASTASSMVALEMEIFSNSQLILLTLLMFLGGEVFTSMLDLLLARYKFTHMSVLNRSSASINPFSPTNESPVNADRVELVLKNKGIKIATFSLFTVVSTFASCGFVPTNENMIIFKNNSGLLLLILPHVFLGNTLYPPCLRLVIMLLKKVSKREEFSYLLKNSKDMHLLPAVHCCLLVATVLGLNLIQFVMFCSIEWNSKIMEGSNVYQKLVASIFQVTNTRHAGESVFDLSSMSSAILLLFIVMMYLPPYTTYLPVNREKENDVKRKEKSIVECVVMSQLSYLVIFIILICITESKSLKEDPLNFNVLNITLEVIRQVNIYFTFNSAYGNVGFSTGYSCARQLKPNGMCKDSWVGFSGRWSNKGKFILILVMFFGRLKKFNMKGGKAWNLSWHM
uniref:Sodium transporter HKT1 n=1 Tax=Cajanus cajan TaxID=3821 RepID=A0A151T2U0_CAJCA|nr:Sodium transporter HKT1 [Cajanus cajan]